MREYFRSGNKIETETRVAVRPLGYLSDYVINGLPENLAAANPRLILQASEILSGPIRIDLLAKEEDLTVARLDVLMLERGLAQLGERPGTNLTELIITTTQLTDRPPFLTYEDLVINNPAGDIRTFTSGEVGSAEADFYRLHQECEQIFTQMSQDLNWARWSLQFAQFGEAITHLDKTLAAFAPLNQLTAIVGQAMPKDLYDQFRPFLVTNPLFGSKGPSGAFSAGIPTLELLLAGEKLPEEHASYFQDNSLYFPNSGQDLRRLKQNADLGQSLRSLTLALGKPKVIWQKLQQIEENIRLWRGTHRKGAETQLPEALIDKLTGTSGEVDAAAFLNDRLKHRLIEE